MSDYIKRSDALNFTARVSAKPGMEEVIGDSVRAVVRHIEAIPTADVIKASRARAKAPVVIGGNICDLRCPDCKARVGLSYHYCWQCGQKLDLRLIHGYAQ